MLSSVHTALSVKCIQEQREFFKMRFSFFYGLDTRREREEKRTCWGKKKKVLLESVLFCFLLYIPFSLKTITSEVLYFPPSGWVGKLDACFCPDANSFLLLHPSGYPDQCVHMTGDAIWQALPSSFTLFLFLFCSVSKRPVVQRWQTRWKSGSPF